MKDILVKFLEGIIDYEKESGKPIAKDDRSPEKFVNIFLEVNNEVRTDTIMTKTAFIHHMEKLEQMFNQFKKLQEWLRDEKADDIWKLFELHLQLIKNMFDMADFCTLISDFVYEHDFGRVAMTFYDNEHNVLINITDAGTLYDYLTMEV